MNTSEGTSEMSYWINFFINAGIPASDAVQYAVMFVNNRIDASMLLDLNKEYLNDIGITLLGDVIAILKNAKAVHRKSVEEKALLLRGKAGVLSKTVAVPTPAKPAPVLLKRDSPLSRAVGHCLSSRRSASPSVTAGAPDKGPTSLKKARNILVPESRPPCSATVTTKATQPVVSGNKKNVFDRLGETSTSEALISTAAKETVSSESVFSRLGAKKRVAPNTAPEDGTPLPYAGVLVASAKKPKLTPTVSSKTASAHKAVPATPHPQAPVSEGIFADGAEIPKRLKDRLGKVVSPADTTAGAAGSVGAVDMASRVNLKITTKNVAGPKAHTPAGMMSRLDMGQGEVSSSSDHPASAPQASKASILSRLGKQH